MQNKTTSYSVSRLFGLLALASAACAGADVGSGNDKGPPGAKPVADDGTRGTPVIALGERWAAEGKCEAPMVAPQPLRRLSRLEYNNAVRDLLGDETAPASALVAEEKVAGFVSNSMSPISPLAAEQYLIVAEAVAERAAEKLSMVTGCNDARDKECVKAFLNKTIRRAFRGTWPEEERMAFMSDFDALANDDVKAAFTYGVAHMLASHRFLFTVETGSGASGVVPLTGAEVAARLALTLWRSVPDEALLKAADEGRLKDAEGVRTEARRLLADPKADSALADFGAQWLNVDQAPSAKDGGRFPQFTPALGSAMAEETQRFFVAVVRDEGGRMQDLLTADYTFANRDLSTLYGAGDASGSDFARTKLPPERRGVLTHAAVLANAAHPAQASPVLRGLLVREHMLCDPVQPPPPTVNTNVQPIAGKSDEDVFDAHANQGGCSGCHKYLDPIGRGFAGFDAIGVYKAGANAAGNIEPPALTELPDDVSGPFTGVVELSSKLAASKQVQQCYAVQTMRWALAREEETADACALHDVWQAFDASGHNLREILIALVGTPAFRHRAVYEGGKSCR